jgi:hypothetical protein
MRFYTTQHQFYCGTLLHARLLAICILDQAGNIGLKTRIAADKELPPLWQQSASPGKRQAGRAPLCVGCRWPQRATTAITEPRGATRYHRSFATRRAYGLSCNKGQQKKEKSGCALLTGGAHIWVRRQADHFPSPFTGGEGLACLSSR